MVLGVLAATALAFAAGWLVARRAITPIAELTAAAAEIERTGDPSVKLPEPTADDEVAELSRTLQTMLTSLADARARTEAALARQRAFVADASHELRTPLTSVLANLELLEDALHGQEREIAQSALRSTQRMRRLVADLLLLARSDVQQRRGTRAGRGSRRARDRGRRRARAVLRGSRDRARRTAGAVFSAAPTTSSASRST